jgi:phosphoglucosamine mutase
MKIAFGTDGIRGTAGTLPITERVAIAVGRAIAARGAARVLIARDTRPSGDMLAAGVAQGVAAGAAAALDAGVLPTSGLAAALRAGLADVGVMITASHNPAEDNGFKVLGPGGRKLTPAEDRAIEAEIAIAMTSEPAPSRRPAQRCIEPALDAYLQALKQAFGDTAPLAGHRLAVDLANGAASALREPLTSLLPAELVFVDVVGPINAACGSEHPEALQAAVVRHACAAGIAVDGDGDRCRLVDESSVIVAGDALAHALVRAGHHRALAVTVMSNAALEPSLPGVRVVRTDVGDRHLLQAIADGEATLGCEESGHVVFSDALPTGDGLVTGVRAVAAALRVGTASAYFSEFIPYPRRLGKIRVSHRPPLPEITDDRLGPNGRIFLRYSGTEPVLRALIEGDTVAGVEATYRDVIARLEADLSGAGRS